MPVITNSSAMTKDSVYFVIAYINFVFYVVYSYFAIMFHYVFIVLYYVTFQKYKNSFIFKQPFRSGAFFL